MNKKLYINNIFKHPLLIIFVFYALSYSLMIINPGVYWDDWNIFNQPYNSISLSFIASGATGGHPVATNIHYFLQNITNTPGLVYHSVTFVLFFIAIIVFYKLLQSIKMGMSNRFIITILFAVLPFNIARICMWIFPYSIGFVFMLSGLLLFANILNENKILNRIFSLTCLFIAYYLLNSVLVFAPICILLLLIVKYYNNSISFKSNSKFIMNRLLKYPDFIILPMIYWIIKIIYFQPIAFWAGYNHVGFWGIITSPIALLKTIYTSFLKLPIFSLSNILNVNMLIPFVVITAFSFILIRKTIFRTSHETLFKIDFITLKFSFINPIRIPILIIIGIILFLAGTFSYNVVGHIPRFSPVGSRDQILLGFGTAFILFDLLRWFINIIIIHKYQLHVFIFSLSILTSLFIVTNINQNIDALRAYLFHESVKIDFKSSEEMKTGKNFVFKDNFNSIFWRKSLRYYSLSGMAKEVFDEQTRLIIPQQNVKQVLNYFQYYSREEYLHYLKAVNMRDIKFDGTFDYNIYAKIGKYNLSSYNILKLIYLKYCDEELFINNIDNISSLIFEKYN